MRERKETRKGSGVQFGSPGAQCAVVYVDSEGQLHENLEQLDKSDPHRWELSEKVWNPAKNP